MPLLIRQFRRIVDNNWSQTVTGSIPSNPPSNRMDIMIMRLISATTAGLLLLFRFHCSAASPDFEALKADAEKQYAEGSYALAHETYAKVPLADLAPTDKRW